MKRDFAFSQELRMDHQVLPNGGRVILPEGAIDTATSEQFKNRVVSYLEDNAPASALLVDLSRVKYISSVGLGALIQLMKKSRQRQSPFALYDPQLAVRRVLEISKLDFLLVDPAGAGLFGEYVSKKEAAKAAAIPPTPSPSPKKKR